MTIGMGWTGGDGSILACDEQQTWGNDKDLGADKHFEVGGIHLVLAGNPSAKYFAVEVLTLVFSSAVPQHRPFDSDVWTDIGVRLFARSFRAALEDYDWKPELEPGKAPYWDVSMLLTDGRRLFELNANLVPREIPPETYAAIGIGWDKAMAVATAFRGIALPEGTIITTAVETAIAHSMACGGRAQTFEVLPADEVRLVW